MPTTEEILKAAGEVGKLLAQHDTVRRLEGALKMLQNDLASQRALADFNRTLQTLAQREAQGQGITAQDKARLEELQRQVVRNPTLRAFQMAQMDYLDLLRKIDDVIQGASGVEAPVPGTPGTPGSNVENGPGGLSGGIIAGPGLM